jgi:hypothetical protein
LSVAGQPTRQTERRRSPSHFVNRCVIGSFVAPVPLSPEPELGSHRLVHVDHELLVW